MNQRPEESDAAKAIRDELEEHYGATPEVVDGSIVFYFDCDSVEKMLWMTSNDHDARLSRVLESLYYSLTNPRLDEAFDSLAFAKAEMLPPDRDEYCIAVHEANEMIRAALSGAQKPSMESRLRELGFEEPTEDEKRQNLRNTIAAATMMK